MIQIEQRPVSSLVPYARNSRKNDHAVDRMCASIREFGFKVPILARSDGTIVDGHLRLKAAQRLGLEEVPVIACDEWTEAQVKAFRLIANRSVGWAEWDEDLLRLELADLKAFDFDLEMTGFDDKELEAILSPATTGLTDEDAVLEPPKVPTTVPGDVWVCGPHRLMCGDSTNPQHVERLLAGVKPNLMVTDPPYGVSYDPAWRPGASSKGKVLNDDRVDWSDAYSLFTGAIAYVWHADRHASEVQRSLEVCDFEIRCQIIWAKCRFIFSRGHYHWQHEPCWYAVRKGKTGNWTGDRSQSTLWQITPKNDEGKNDHGTQKPIECMRRPIINHTNPGQAVYEPFMGSGTTMIAAETTGRVAFGLELDPVYVDVAVMRWQDFTGKKAVLDGDGRTFEDLVGERSVARGAVPVLQGADLQAGV